MKTVTVHKAELRDALKKNKAKHKAQFDEAIAGWRKKAIKELSKELKKAKEGKKFETHFFLPKPKSYLKEYDRALEMLKWEVGDTIELSREDFTRFVLDEWEWKRDFVGTASNYTASRWAATADDE